MKTKPKKTLPSAATVRRAMKKLREGDGAPRGVKPIAMPGRCNSCGKDYIDHDGIQLTCAKLQKALKALQEINTYTNDGFVVKLSRDALKEAE